MTYIDQLKKNFETAQSDASNPFNNPHDKITANEFTDGAWAEYSEEYHRLYGAFPIENE